MAVAGFLEGLRREARQLPLLRDAGDALDEWAGERAGEDCVGEGGRERAVAGEAVGKAKDVVMERVQSALVALGEKLGFVGGHVHLHRALGLAGLATEAEVEGFVDGVALEAFFAQGAGEHLPEQVGAAAGGVLLLAGGAVAGAHDAADGVAAGADADAALGGASERAVVFCEGEVGLPPNLSAVVAHAGQIGWGTVVGLGAVKLRGMAEILGGVVDAHRVGELAGIHAVVRIPEPFELAEGPDQLGAKHFGQQRRACLAVAVLAGERSAEGDYDIGGAIDELAEDCALLSELRSRS